MSAGTITLANNSDIASGADTAFMRDLVSGDFVVVVVGGITYTLPVQSVDSDQQITLIRKYEGPTQSGLAWNAVPRKTQNQITAEAVAQAAETLRLFNLDKLNWQAVFSESGDITVILPDKSMFSGPSWRKIVEILGEIDIDGVTELADQVRAYALQVETDKQAAQSAAESASTDRKAAEAANSSAQTAKADAETAAGTANSKASEASVSAQEAAAAKAAAEQAAATVHPENLLQNANNLDDLADKPAARQNLDVFSKEEIADMLSGYLGQVEWQEMRSSLVPGTIPRDGQEVSQTGIFADLYAKALAGALPTCTEAEWQADPFKRGCYVLESSPGKMRLPDDNGVQPGSLRIPVKVGDGGVAGREGSMAGSALPNIKGTVVRLGSTSSLMRNDSIVDGAFELLQRETVSPPSQGATIATLTSGVPLGFNAKLYDGIYQDNVTEIRPNRQYGCWTVRFATKATNGGSIDALALATALAAGDAALEAKILANNARIGYALLNVSNPAINSRTVIANPFGNNTPVECMAEFYHATLQKWVKTTWVYASSTSIHGTEAAYSEGEGIILKIGLSSYASAAAGNSQDLSATYSTPSPVRIHVRKITA
ncbi:TPA: hypothetical protein PFE16_004207 [Kluyvera georgiana]|nr:hypothetical protein [Kluyvera georgiana]